MTSATSILRSEHVAILKMLDATEEAARRAKSGETVRVETLRGLLEFFRTFADQCHHGKEEQLLFPLLESKGLPRAGGPLGVMLYEHDKGRALIRQMSDATDALGAGDSGAAGDWAAAAFEYAALLRAHIDKENNILFVMAERLLTDAEQAGLSTSFERLEVEQIGEGTHERLHASMNKLIDELTSAADAAR